MLEETEHSARRRKGERTEYATGTNEIAAIACNNSRWHASDPTVTTSHEPTCARARRLQAQQRDEVGTDYRHSNGTRLAQRTSQDHLTASGTASVLDMNENTIIAATATVTKMLQNRSGLGQDYYPLGHNDDSAGVGRRGNSDAMGCCNEEGRTSGTHGTVCVEHIDVCYLAQHQHNERHREEPVDVPGPRWQTTSNEPSQSQAMFSNSKAPIWIESIMNFTSFFL